MSLEVKRRIRKTTPRFKRHAFHRKARLSETWRKPRGLHNKQRDSKMGSFARISNGYRTPQDVRGMHCSGLIMVHAHRVQDIEGINPKTHAVVVASVGAKNQLAILNVCNERKIRVLNHDSKKRIEQIATQRANAKAKAEATKNAKLAKEKKETKKDDKKEELSPEEKKEEQDKIKEEVLTKGKGN